MALPSISFTAERKTPEYDAGGYSPAQVDPNLLRLLAERKKKQGIAGVSAPPGQQAPQQQQGFSVQQAPIDPRLRAAMMLRDKLRQRQQGQQAPTYAGVQPRNT